MIENKQFDKKGCPFNTIFRKEIRFQEDKDDNWPRKLTCLYFGILSKGISP